MKMLRSVQSIVLLVACYIFYPSISNCQNVGIGTTTPVHKLSVIGNASISGNLFVNTTVKEFDERITVRTGIDSFGLIHTDGKRKVGTWVGSYIGADGGWLGTLSKHNLYFFTNNGGALVTVDTLGNVGIGTNTPTVKLDVVNDLRVLGAKASFTVTNSNAAVNGAVVVGQLTGISNPPQFRFRSASGNNTDLGLDVNNFFVIEANEAPSFTMHPAGYFGIGLGVYGSPLQRLSVRGDQEDAVYIENNNPAFRALYVKGTAVINGILVKPGGSFKIDHPLDPENKYLSHSFVESPDMMNVYNGNIVTDKNGNATITMPDWFEALNRDFRYQLTVLGQFAQAIVSEKMKDNVFIIKTDKPNVEVSWQVTGIRHDAWANKNRIPVEENKTTKEKGKYLSPESFGKPASMSVR